MALTQLNLIRIILSGSISWGLYLIMGYSNVQSQPINSTDNKQVKSVEFNPPQASDEEADFENDDQPRTRKAGAGRDECPEVDVPLTALFPVTALDPNMPMRTVLERPRFLFYVPYTSNNVHRLEFILQDSQENEIDEQSFASPEKPGIIQVNLSSDAILQLNEQYHWFLKIYCDSQDPKQYVFVEADVERIVMTNDLENDLVANEPKKYMAYAKYGIWYDAIANLAELRDREPENMQFQEDWMALLEDEDVDLSSIAEQYLLDCCTNHHTRSQNN